MLEAAGCRDHTGLRTQGQGRMGKVSKVGCEWQKPFSPPLADISPAHTGSQAGAPLSPLKSGWRMGMQGLNALG